MIKEFKDKNAKLIEIQGQKFTRFRFVKDMLSRQGWSSGVAMGAMCTGPTVEEVLETKLSRNTRFP